MDHTHTTVTIIGCGYVGLTLGAVLANAGVTVYAIEINPKRLAVIRQGRSFFYEAGADRLIAAAVKSGKLIPTDTYDQAIPASEIIFSCVGTPDNPDGSSNLAYVFDAAQQALPLLRKNAIFVQKSTVPVGTGAKLQQLFAASDKPIAYVSCPEFSREGTAIGDTLWFDRVVTGSANKQTAERVLDLHRLIAKQQVVIATVAGLTPPASSPEPHYMTVDVSSAELIKVTANAFLALKISFANSIAKLADQAGADVTAVMDGVGTDRRIGRAFLQAGRGYGGGCFPKDVSGLIRSAEEHGVDMEIMRAATGINDAMPHYIIRKAAQALDGNTEASFRAVHISVLGLSFKAGTSDTRRSPAIVIANTLARMGALVQAYDPEANQEAAALLDKSILLVDSIDKAVDKAVCIFIATDWPEFLHLDLPTLADRTGARAFVDCMNKFDSAAVTAAGFTYVGVGRP